MSATTTTNDSLSQQIKQGIFEGLDNTIAQLKAKKVSIKKVTPYVSRLKAKLESALHIDEISFLLDTSLSTLPKERKVLGIMTLNAGFHELQLALKAKKIAVQGLLNDAKTRVEFEALSQLKRDLQDKDLQIATLEESLEAMREQLACANGTQSDTKSQVLQAKLDEVTLLYNQQLQRLEDDNQQLREQQVMLFQRLQELESHALATNTPTSTIVSGPHH